MKKFILIVFLLTNYGVHAQNIVALEYFFNTDPGFGNGTQASITPAPNISNLNINADVTALPQGVHQLYVRSRDANGVWSITNRSFFYKSGNGASTANPNIVALEYFFDTDPGFGAATQATISAGTNIANLNINADVTALPQGVHQLYVRSQDANGVWSITNRSFFYKSGNGASTTNPNIVALEYFFDTDPGFGAATQATISAGTNIANLNINADVTALPQGVHQLYIRSRDANGVWSITNRSFFYKSGDGGSISNPDIVALEYFFDTDPGFGSATSVAITPSQNIANLNFNADMSSIGFGIHNLYVRSKDANNVWSITNRMFVCRDSMKVLLQGFYAGGGLMTTALMNQGIGSDITLTDSIDVELHESNYPYSKVASAKALLHNDGTFSCVFTQDIPDATYYRVIRHRNSIETWSATPIGFYASPHNFSTSASQAYGSNQTEVEPGVFAIHSGDMNQDGTVELADYTIWETDANNFEAGYRNADLNGDGSVDISDYSFWEANANNFIGVSKP